MPCQAKPALVLLQRSSLLSLFCRIFVLGKGLWKSRYVPLDRTFISQELDVSTVNLDIACIALLLVVFSTQRSETPVLGNNDLLAAREFVL